MADVIFNGVVGRGGPRIRPRSRSPSTTRTTFCRSIPLQVHITRRVYRSGEGEYLINRQPSRLKDIRSLLSGTGMGTQAYSVIEQGKVDGLLQSSRSRPAFDFRRGRRHQPLQDQEARSTCGDLERVEQNLLRLADIVDEVDLGDLRSVRAQAGKARRYKEYTDRLQELRTQVGLADWQRLTEQIESTRPSLLV